MVAHAAMHGLQDIGQRLESRGLERQEQGEIGILHDQGAGLVCKAPRLGDTCLPGRASAEDARKHGEHDRHDRGRRERHDHPSASSRRRPSGSLLGLEPGVEELGR